MTYERPLVLNTCDLAEGVYAASGQSSDNSPTSYTLDLIGQWDGNKIYQINFTNNTDEKVNSVTVILNVTGNVTGIGGNVSGSVSGNRATVTFTNYGNGIAAHATVGTDYMLVTGTGDFSVE